MFYVTIYSDYYRGPDLIHDSTEYGPTGPGGIVQGYPTYEQAEAAIMALAQADDEHAIVRLNYKIEEK